MPNAQDELIAKAAVSGDRLFVLSSALRRYEIPFDASPALKSIPKAGWAHFTVTDDGSYVHWPAPDIHLDLGAIRAALDPKARAKAVAAKTGRDARYGAAIAGLRVSKRLKQSDIAGFPSGRCAESKKAKKQPLTRCGVWRHGMSLNDYLHAAAENVRG